ncbi:MAG: KH domain-containing protein [Clostridia bacterium]|nr:KH domain-containing protein [Clostridia bacterium]
MEELVRYLVKSVVGDDEFEVVLEEANPKLSIIKVKANDESIGKIIGRNGRTISSIRTILRSASARSGKKYILKVND